MGRRIVTLTTDFGLSDPYVGIMKGVILAIAPDALLVDLCHDVPPQDVVTGAIMLQTAVPCFAADTVHLAVVDPGVGSARAAVAVETEHGVLVGPDNGLFAAALERWPAIRAVRLTNPRFHRQPVSATFHGRDIFAPCAAHLAAGVPLEELGEPAPRLEGLPVPRPAKHGRRLELHVLSVDRFGNLVTDLTAEEYEGWSRAHSGHHRVRFSVGGTEIPGLCRTYSDVRPGQPLAYFGSGGRLEIGVRDGSAFAVLRAKVGDTVWAEAG